MVKNKNGVTLVALMVTIVVMLVIFSVTLVSSNGLLRNSQMNRLKTNMYLIKARAQTLLEDYQFEGNDIDEEIVITYDGKYSWKVNEELDIIFIQEWNIGFIKSQGIDTSKIASDEVFTVYYNITKNEVDVYSKKGVKDDDGKPYHYLSELEEQN